MSEGKLYTLLHFKNRNCKFLREQKHMQKPMKRKEKTFDNHGVRLNANCHICDTSCTYENNELLGAEFKIFFCLNA